MLIPRLLLGLVPDTKKGAQLIPRLLGVPRLASTDTPAAETALRRQLTDPSSALRRLLPGLVAESSAVP